VIESRAGCSTGRGRIVALYALEGELVHCECWDGLGGLVGWD